MNINKEPQRVIHTFVSKSANSNTAGQFTFLFREPIRNIIGGRIKSCGIKTFVGINNSAVYYLRTDSILGTRDSSFFNAKPNQVVSTLFNTPHLAGQPIYREDDSDGFMYSFPKTLQNIWFEVLDENYAVINPPDVGWYFIVEIEFLIINYPY